MEQELLGVKSQYPALRAIVNKLASEEVIQTGTTHGIGRHSCVMDKVMRWRWKLEEGSTEVAFGRTFYRDEVYLLFFRLLFLTFTFPSHTPPQKARHKFSEESVSYRDEKGLIAKPNVGVCT